MLSFSSLFLCEVGISLYPHHRITQKILKGSLPFLYFISTTCTSFQYPLLSFFTYDFPLHVTSLYSLLSLLFVKPLSQSSLFCVSYLFSTPSPPHTMDSLIITHVWLVIILNLYFKYCATVLRHFLKKKILVRLLFQQVLIREVIVTIFSLPSLYYHFTSSSTFYSPHHTYL